MEKFVAKSDYKLMVEAANANGIETAGLKRPELAAALNAKVEEIGEEAFQKAIEAAAQPAEPTSETTTEGTVVRGKQPKWYEVEGFEFKEDEVVEIENHKIAGLNGRFAVINKASAKKEAVKAFLLNAKTAERQATNVTLDYTTIKRTGKTQEEVIQAIKDATAAKEKEVADKKAAAEAAKAAKQTEKATPATATTTEEAPAANQAV